MEEVADVMARSPQTKEKGKADSHIIGIFITLCICSIVESYSASSREIYLSGNIYTPMVKHLALLAVAAAIVWSLQRVNYTKMVVWSLAFAALTVLLMVYTMFFGDVINGARRSFSLPGISIQPAELAKIAIVFVLSYILAQNINKKEISGKGLICCVGIVSLFGLLLLLQGLTNTILFMSISFAMLIIGGTKTKKLLKVIGIYLVIAVLFLGVKHIRDEFRLDELDGVEQVDAGTSSLRSGTWQNRMSDYFSELFGSEPYNNPEILSNDQKLYSYLAQANGGVFGEGPGGSRETSRLPLAFSDYVFSIVTEDLGLIGALILLSTYLLLLVRAGKIARRCNRAYPAFLVMGMAVMIVLQALFHMAINTGVFPVSGQNLPLISKGGTSILVMGVAFGVMLSVSRSAAQKGVDKKVGKQETLPESISASNPTRE